MASEDGGTPAQVTRTGPGGSFEFVDANLDPELAMAIRISMEEERQRQERAAAEAAAAGGVCALVLLDARVQRRRLTAGHLH